MTLWCFHCDSPAGEASSLSIYGMWNIPNTCFHYLPNRRLSQSVPMITFYNLSQKNQTVENKCVTLYYTILCQVQEEQSTNCSLEAHNLLIPAINVSIKANPLQTR